MEDQCKIIAIDTPIVFSIFFLRFGPLFVPFSSMLQKQLLINIKGGGQTLENYFKKLITWLESNLSTAKLASVNKELNLRRVGLQRRC